MPASSPFQLQPIAAPPVTRERVTDLSASCGGPARGQLDLWLLPLPGLQRHASSLVAVVSDEERLTCGRLTNEAAQLRCRLYRGAVRAILSGYLGRPAQELCFTRAAGGKPQVSDEPGAGLRFNLSHSGELLAIACARGMEVGVDVEQVSGNRRMADIAARYFHPREAAVIRALDDEAKRDQFLRWWTAKEALLKAQGLGIAHQLARLDLSGWTNQPAAEITAENGTRWFAARPVEFPAHAVAVACAHPPARLRILELAS